MTFIKWRGGWGGRNNLSQGSPMNYEVADLLPGPSCAVRIHKCDNGHVITYTGTYDPKTDITPVHMRVVTADENLAEAVVVIMVQARL